ncbi:MAG TPA: serine/threonine-protein kinase [Actinomycetes bacterium]|nr:serine/threonine-protein kinase [Actinomycetes bacterium]
MATPAADRLVADRYALKASIGRGGMGVVWRARDTVLGREVAVKEVVFPPTMPEEERRPAQARVMREARAAARLNHPAAVILYDVVQDHGGTFIVMELVNAPTLADVVRSDGPLPVERAAEIGAQVASALEAAHQAGIVHRDVKPGNVMVPANGMAKLADFGIASLQGDPQLTSTGLVIGSPAYMAPEQAKGEGSGPPADFWALGGTIFYAVEGEPPFDRGTSIATLAAVVNEPPRPPRRAGPLAPLLTALLAKDPAARPSGPELRAELARVAAVRPAPPTEVLPVQGPGRSVPLADPEPEPPEPEDPTPVPPVTAEEAPSAAEAPAPAAAAVPPAPADEPPGPGTDREVATAGDPAATQRPARPLLPPAPPASRRGRAVGLLVLLAVVAVAAVLLAANLRSDGDGDPSAAPATAAGTRPSETTGQGSSTTAASQTTAAPTTTAAGGQLPEGWRAFTNQRGSNRVGVPPGWEARTRNSFNATVVQEQQASERVFTVRSTNPANPLPQASREYRDWAPQNFEDFREVRYEENQTYAGRPGAVVFEYEARRDGRQVHVSHINLKGRTWGYNVEFIVPAELWGDSQELARQFEQTFQPLG